MSPKSPIASLSLLQLTGCLKCLFLVCFVFLGLCACAGIYLLKLRKRKGGLGGIASGIFIIEIFKIRLAVTKFGNDQTHLQTPVTEMHITNYFVSEITAYTLNTLTYDRRTEMSYVERLGNIWSAVINDYLTRSRTLKTVLV